MSGSTEVLHETVTLSQAKQLIRCPGPRAEPAAPVAARAWASRTWSVSAAAESKLPCKSLLGTQIAPEDVSGAPCASSASARVFCPPRGAVAGAFGAVLPVSRRAARLHAGRAEGVLLRAAAAPCRRAASCRRGRGWSRPATGPRTAPSSAPSLLSALVNRVLVLAYPHRHSGVGRLGRRPTGVWAEVNRVRREEGRTALLRPVPRESVPFSTPRAWAEGSPACARPGRTRAASPQRRPRRRWRWAASPPRTPRRSSPPEVRPMSEPDDASTLNQAKTLIHCLAGEESLLLFFQSRTRQVRHRAAGGGRGRDGVPVAAGDADRPGRRRRRAEGGRRGPMCSARRGWCCPTTTGPIACSLTNCRPAPPDVQKAFYSLLLERRLGEHQLPKGSWVIAAGNRTEDRAVVSSLSMPWSTACSS